MKNTERRNPNSTHIDEMSTLETVRLFHGENHRAVRAVEEQTAELVRAIDLVSDALFQGGRLIYVGAGTSGRLGVLDAAECPPTFGVSPDTVVGLIAGGEGCMTRASENAEDSYENGVEDARARGVKPPDVVVGISAAGDAAYVVGAMQHAKRVGCKTVGLTCNADCAVAREGDVSICTDTGAEIVTGSTRLKAGTAQKLVLNMLSTCAMIKTGKIYQNLMINLKPTNKKLKARMLRIVGELTSLGEREAEALLEEYGWDIRAAVDGYSAR